MDPNQNDKPLEEIADDDKPRTLDASPLQTGEHSPALVDTQNVIRRFNRTATWVATGLLGTAIFAAVVLAFQDNHPMAADLAEKARPTSGELLSKTSPAALPGALGSNEKSTGKISPGQLTSSDPGFPAEMNNPEVQAKASSWSTAQRQDSVRAIRPKISNVRHRSSTRSRLADVKMRLIVLWHQSLARKEKSRSWALFSYPNKARRKNAHYATETTH